MSTRMPPRRSPESALVVGSWRTERTSNLGYGYSGFSVEMLPVLARVQLKTVRAPTLRVFWVMGRRTGNFLIRMKLLGVGHPLNLGFHLPGETAPIYSKKLREFEEVFLQKMKNIAK
ncbi:hypothetical protein ACFX1X_023206 [Malus domestica]